MRPIISPKVNEAITPAPGGAGGSAGGTTPPKTTAAGINIPVQAPPAGTDPIATPYDADQPLAEKAYEDAMASIGVQQKASYERYGLGPEGEMDPWTHQLGLIQQQQRANAASLAGIEAGQHQRGLTGGIAGQAESAGQLAAAGGLLGVANAAIAEQTGYATQGSQALSDRDARIRQDVQSGIDWIQQNQLYTPHAQYRSSADVNALVHQAAADWVKKYGGLGKTNKAGQTFQQRLDMYGQALYDPTKTFRFGGKNYGTATGGT